MSDELNDQTTTAADTGQVVGPSGDDAITAYTALEAATALGLNERTIRRAIKSGQLPAVKTSGGYRIVEADLAAFAALRQLKDEHRPLISVGPMAKLHGPPEPVLTGERGFPQPLTGIVGRKRERAQIIGMLRRDDVRLITLIGTGGVGKTRLALDIAEWLTANAADPVRFVALDAVADRALVLPTIGRAVGVREGGGRPLLERIAAVLGDRPRVLILDNFEHLLAAATDVIALLSACPRLKIVVTSRAILRVSGEHLVQIDPLPTPTRHTESTPDDLRAFDAVALFVARAGAVEPAFSLTTQNAPAVAEICQRLDGLPLAIEMAAARSRVLSPRALLARLEPRLPVLIGGARDQPARLRTMRSAIAWSYDLLDPDVQMLFRLCAVFSGGFTVAAAEALVGARRPDTEQELATPILDRIETLIDHNLVFRQATIGDDDRFAMLDTIRAYGQERLAAAGENAAAHDALARYFLERAEQKWPTAFAATMDEWLRRLDVELPNLRIAFAWLQANGRIDDSLRLATGLRQLCWVRGHAREGGEWLSAALTQTHIMPDELRAIGLLCQGEFALHYGAYVAAESALIECYALYTSLNDRISMAFALNALGMATNHLRAFARSESYLREALDLIESIDDSTGNSTLVHGFVLFNLGMGALAQQNYEQAERHYEAALAIQRQLTSL